ncbi:hypothetical protein D4764_06G0008780 [Takifugu flavidus]|uniref:Uncharacterized protein n=1 Tax=Takifugu flavidus TaxID=433684 RepID=A0A5C6MY69_9TELE|nr:hypothetical protein D4764_06G0008780 [Takifugu flavidus]
MSFLLADLPTKIKENFQDKLLSVHCSKHRLENSTHRKKVAMGTINYGTAHAEFEKLTRRHAVKVLPEAGVSVEEVSYAVGEVVGFESVKSASRMNKAVVIFIDDVSKVERLVESGVILRDTFTPV